MNYLVVGLGNIGAEYASTRHNMGFMVLDAWAQASNLVFESRRYGSVAECSYRGRKLILLKPSTYMNLSGNAVRYWMHKMNIPTERIIVICDDLNLPFGTVRMRMRGSDGGHNGLAHIGEMLESKEWARLRIGIGHDFALGGQIDYVLGSLSEEQLQELPGIARTVAVGLRTWAFLGVQKAMSQLNSRIKTEKNAIED